MKKHPRPSDTEALTLVTGDLMSARFQERRNTQERRKNERRRSVRYTAETLVVIDGVTWIDNEGTDRRRKVRRREDRERIAQKILDDSVVTDQRKR